MSTVQQDPSRLAQASPEAPAAEPWPHGRAGGIVTLGKGTMPPVFTALILVGALDVFLLLLLPYGLYRGSESAWVQSPHLAFMGMAILTGLVFGMLAAITADRRGHSAWWFLAGHLGTFVAPVLSALGMSEDHPSRAQLIVAASSAFGAVACFVMVGSGRATPHRYGRLTFAISRTCYHSGNIWLGIGLLVVLTAALIQGTRMEDHFGHKAAFSLVYASWWFGLLYMAFAISLICATVRKYPWRVDQAGWLTVHTALVLIIIGTFMTFWGKKEGNLRLQEGESASIFHLATETRLQVLEMGRGKGAPRRVVGETVVDFDLDPSELYPDTSYTLPLGEGMTFDVKVDTYYPSCKEVEAFSNDAPMERMALRGVLIPPGGGRPNEFWFLKENPVQPIGMLKMAFHSAPADESKVPPGSIWFVSDARSRSFDWIYKRRSGELRKGRVENGELLGLGLPMKIRVVEAFTHLNYRKTLEFDGYNDRNPVIKVRFPENIHAGRGDAWLGLFGHEGHPFHFASKNYMLRWTRSTHPLGFKLKLNDFNRHFYPGSSQERTFESYLEMTDRESNDERLRNTADIKIDMNHPLRYKGWRLYQSSFAEGPKEVTFLQVNRDPGRNVTYFACALLSLSLVIVFFQKRFLRAWARYLKQRRASPHMQVMGAIAVVLLGFLACLPGVISLTIINEGPELLFGVIGIIGLLIIETVVLNKVAADRLEARNRSRPAAA